MFFLSHLIYSFSVIYGNTQSLFYELFYELILNPKLEGVICSNYHVNQTPTCLTCRMQRVKEMAFCLTRSFYHVKSLDICGWRKSTASSQLLSQCQKAVEDAECDNGVPFRCR